MGVGLTSSLIVAAAVKPMAPHNRLRSWSFLAALAQAIWIMIDFLNEKLAFTNEFEFSTCIWSVATSMPVPLPFSPTSSALVYRTSSIVTALPRLHVLVATAPLLTLIANIARLI